MQGFIRILSLLLLVLLAVAAVVQGQEEVRLSEGCQAMAAGAYNMNFTGNEDPAKVVPAPFNAGEDIILSLEDLDGDRATNHDVSIAFSGTANDGTGTFPFAHTTSGTINDGFPLHLIIVDLEWDGDYFPFVFVVGTRSSSFRLTATCAAQATPTEREQCMGDSWAALGFRNRGECIRSVTGQGSGG